MGLFRACVWCLAVLLAGAAVRAQTVDLSGKVTAADIQRATNRGKLMQVYDRAAWITTDDLLAKLPRQRQADVGGWIVTPAPEGVHIDYVGKGDRAERSIYSANVANGRILSSAVYPADALPPLSDLARRMRAAQNIASTELLRRKTWRPCTKAAFNAVVLPPQENGNIPVYFITPQVDATAFPFGGHYEIDIAQDGTVAASRPFSKSCLNMKRPKNKAGREDDRDLFLFTTHLLDPQPTEMHVFQQLASGNPLVVMTTPNRTVWRIEKGEIKPVLSITDGRKAR